MTVSSIAGVTGAILVGLGLYGFIVNPQLLRKVLAFSVIGSGVFLLFGVIARRGAGAGFHADPVPQALVITGIVVAFAASAIAVALILRLYEATGRLTLDPNAWTKELQRRGRQMTAALATSAGGALLVPAILLPVAGMIVSFLLGGKWAERITLAIAPAGLALAVAIAVFVWRTGAPIVYIIGGVSPPLGIALQADGVSAALLVVTALIIPAASLFARANFETPPGVSEARAPLVFWIMLQAIWAALALLFLGHDLFNLYVGIELLTFAAAPLVCVSGKPETLAAALRYLLFALCGSIFYLLGAALFYGTYGTLDLALLSERVQSVPPVWLAAALMTAGLLAKTALFPLHLWLPPAHANAPAGASAVLSGLVVKGSFFVVVRLWFTVLPALTFGAASAFLAALGSGAILFGSVIALKQPRLKLLVAYSTIAQIGYLFLIFPLAAGSHRLERRRLDGRLHAGDVPRLREGGDVPRGGTDRRSARS